MSDKSIDIRYIETRDRESREERGGEGEREAKAPRTKRFKPPSQEDVASYCKERGNGIDPAAFVDYYTARGWKISNNSIKDWRACVRTWEKRESGSRAPPIKPLTARNYTQRNDNPDEKTAGIVQDLVNEAKRYM